MFCLDRYAIDLPYFIKVSAVKDKNDRVVFGDAKNAQDLLEYIVLERHLGSDHGKWRICGKLFPKKP